MDEKNPLDYKFDVALSFAGEDREYVEEVALLLKAHGVRAFYDKFEEDKLWGKNLYEYLHNVYTKQAKFTVMFISKHYKEKLWTSHEREAMQERAFQSSSEYILPARFDDTEIPGVLATTGYISLDQKSPSCLVNLILSKLNWHVKERWWGSWEVDSVTSAYGAYLHISEVAANSFKFDLSVHNGAHMGQIDGVAEIQNTSEALYISDSPFEDEEPCKLQFRKMNNQIQVEESYGCHVFHGMRAHFGGDYRLIKDAFYYIDEVKDHHLSIIYKILGHDQWGYYSDCFSDIHNYSENGEGGKIVISGGMAGLYTICESILVIENEVIWGAFLRDETVYYFTSLPGSAIADELESWRERFKERNVVMLDPYVKKDS